MGQPESLDQVRDILFGGQMRDYERRVLARHGFDRRQASCREQQAEICPEISLPDFLYAGGLIIIGIVLYGVNRVVAGRTGTIDPEQLRG